MAKRWCVSDGSNVIEFADARIAIGGVVKTISAACVAHEGIVRHFWPPAAGLADSNIKWTTDALTVTQQAIDPLDSYASITFYRDSGEYIYKDFPEADVISAYLSPPVSGANQYMIMVHQVSGTALTGTLDTWIDLNSAASHTWSLDETAAGSLSAVAQISIAQDDGAGSPVYSTMVLKTVTFASTVVSATDIIWSTLQRDLIEIKTTENADCVLTFNPAGFAVGAADSSGSFTENWHIESPSLADPENFTVYVTVISGTNPTGSALDTLLTLDQVREWTLATAAAGDDFSCELDVTVDDLVPAGNDVTKRITMNSVRNTVVAEPAWTTTAWAATDAGFPQGAALDVFVYLTFDIDGTATLEMETTAMSLTEFETENWFDTPPPTAGELNDYEVMLDYQNGAGIQSPMVFGTWYRMTETRVFTVLYTTRLNNAKTYRLYANVRKVGGTAIQKTITITVIKSDGTTP